MIICRLALSSFLILLASSVSRAQDSVEELEPMYQDGEFNRDEGGGDEEVDEPIDDSYYESYQLDDDSQTNTDHQKDGNDDEAGSEENFPPPRAPELFSEKGLPAFHQVENEYSLLRRDPDKVQNFWWPPLVSIPAPGFGQWYQGQYEWAAAYGALATAGVGVALANIPDGQGDDETDKEYWNRQLLGTRERRFALGFQTYQVAGGLSAYHSFRTAVRTHQKKGRFLFLRQEEQISDILLAPLRFQYLARPTTFVPLTIGVGLAVLIQHLSLNLGDDYERRSLTSSDVFFSGAISYNAGTHEEAIFRGWLQPMFFHLFNGQGFWANTLTSGMFAAAHLPTNPFPLPQFFLGWHFGWVTQRNNWTIGESVFIHVWWDVIAFLTQYQMQFKEGNDHIRPALHLPPLEFHF